MKKVQNNFKKNIFYILFINPSVYLQRLLSKTMMMGFFTLVLQLFLKWAGLQSLSIPSTMHGLIGIVIGLLLVFRTNTSYDRWWEGRKLISQLASEIGIISAKIGASFKESNKEKVNDFKSSLSEFLQSLQNYLIKHPDSIDINFHLSQKNAIQKTIIDLHEIEIQDYDKNYIEQSILKTLDYSNSLERIKNTPIPISYVLHIRVSILIYLSTLPFGLFHDLGMWSTPMVMLVYYIISGVEIISTEIENPFAGDPNDLPVSTLFKNIEETLNK